MRILFLCKDFPPASGYGAMRYAAGLCRGLADRGHQVHVLAENAGALCRTLRRGNPTVHSMGRPWPFHHYDADSDALLKANQLLGGGLKLCRREGSFDVVCFQGWETSLPGLALSNRLGAPAVFLAMRTAFEGHVQPADGAARYRAEMEAWACEHSSLAVCPSPATADEVSGRYGVNGQRLLTLAPACDPGLIDPGDTHLDDFRALFAAPDELAVLFAGSLTPGNTPESVLEALPQVLDRAEKVKAVFAGDGPLAGRLMQDSERLGVADHCFFAGGVGQCVLAALYRTCDVLVCPATYAPSGIAAVEGFSAGLPVVASDTGALSDLVRDGGNGFLIPPGDPDGLAGALVWLADHRDRLSALGAEAQVRGTTWTWEAAADGFVDALSGATESVVESAAAGAG